jgi:hypothetical protein
MQLYADKLVELQVVESISDETVRRTRKKMPATPGETHGGVSCPRPMPTVWVPGRTPWKSLIVRMCLRMCWCA